MGDERLLQALELDDSYHVVRVLANHPSGTTELVSDSAGCLYVRKRIPRELANREAWEALARLEGPRIPRVEHVFELPDALVVVCRHVVGTTVAQLLERQVRIEPHEAAGIALGVCRAAATLHAWGIVHRDISPGNVVIAPNVVGDSPSNRTYLIDLGVARVHSDDAAAHDTTPLGTPGFSAPEQYGFAQTDARSDVYSIGRLLACLLTGKVSHEVSLDAAVLAGGDVDPRLRAIVERACAFEPSARYQSASEMAADLAKAELELGGSKVPALEGQDAYGASVPAPAAQVPRRADAARDAGARGKRSLWSLLGFGPAWHAAGLLTRVLVVANWTFALCFVLLFVAGGTDASNYTRPTDVLYVPVAMAVGVMGTAYAAWQTGLCLLGEGPYRDEPRRGMMLLKALGEVTLAVFVLWGVAAFLSGTFATMLPEVAGG